LFDIKKLFIQKSLIEENSGSIKKNYSKKRKEIYVEDEGEEDDNNYIVSDVPIPEELEESPQDIYNQLMELQETLEKENKSLSEGKNLNQYSPDIILSDQFDFQPTEITVIEYDKPVVMDYSHGQFVSQQVEFKNSTGNNVNAYEATMKARDDLGIKSEYSEEFGSMYIKEINGIRDGQDGNWWEFYIKKPNDDIRIAEDPIDKVDLNPGEIIEWRLASEEPGGCGGGSSESDKYKKESYASKLNVYSKLGNVFQKSNLLMNN